MPAILYYLKNSIAVQRSKEPRNMGTLLWQLNDCWPVTSWSITDYSRAPKAGWYAVKEAYRDDAKPQKDSVYPKDIQVAKPNFTFHYLGDSRFSIESDKDAKYVFISSSLTNETFSDNYFDLKAGEKKDIILNMQHLPAGFSNSFRVISLYDILKK